MTTRNHVLADGTERSDMGRRLRVLQVTPELVLTVLAQPHGPIAYEVLEGLPHDAVLVGIEVDQATRCINFYIQSAEYAPVPESVPFPYVPPVTTVRYYGDAYAERLREWEQSGEADA